MLYIISRGDILCNEQFASTVVIPVNCVGVMGAGLALQYGTKSLVGYREYKRMCRDGDIAIGKIGYVLEYEPTVPYVYTVFFPTKNHYRYTTELAWVEKGLDSLASAIARFPALIERGISIPALGCGLGGLKYEDVYPLLQEFSETVGGNVWLYAPKAGDK